MDRDVHGVPVFWDVRLRCERAPGCFRAANSCRAGQGRGRNVPHGTISGRVVENGIGGRASRGSQTPRVPGCGSLFGTHGEQLGVFERRGYGLAYRAVTYSISPTSGTSPASAPSLEQRVIASRPRGP